MAAAGPRKRVREDQLAELDPPDPATPDSGRVSPASSVTSSPGGIGLMSSSKSGSSNSNSSRVQGVGEGATVEMTESTPATTTQGVAAATATQGVAAAAAAAAESLRERWSMASAGSAPWPMLPVLATAQASGAGLFRLAWGIMGGVKAALRETASASLDLLMPTRPLSRQLSRALQQLDTMDQRIAQLSEQVDELTTNDPQQPPPAAPLSSPSNAASRRSTISASRLGGPGTATSANSPPTGSSSSSWSGRASTVQTPSPLRRASSATSSSSSSPSTATTQPAPLPAAAALPASGSPDLMLIAIHELNQAREEMKSVTYALSMAQAASRVSFDEQSATHAPFRFAGHGLTATPSTGATPQTGFGTPSNENVRLRSTGKRRLALRQRLSRRTSPTLAQLLASLDGETLLAAKQALRQTGGNSGVRARRRPLAQQLQAAPAGRTLEQLLQSRFAAVHSPRSPSSPAWQSSPTGNA